MKRNIIKNRIEYTWTNGHIVSRPVLKPKDILKSYKALQKCICRCCDKDISKGEKVVRMHYYDGQRPYSVIFHEKCWKAIVNDINVPSKTTATLEQIKHHADMDDDFVDDYYDLVN